MPGLRRGVGAAREAVRTQLWPLPTIGVVAAVALGVGLPRLDGHVDGHLPAWSGQYLFGGDADAARTVLDAVAGSLITVTSLTFSLTVVTLQLASGQFSPRLLRTFTRDLFVQATLALFLATFTYALTVLRSVRTAGDGQALFVPRLSVTFGFVLAVASVLGLVLFLAHLARQIRVETMLRNVHADASDTANRVLDTAEPTAGAPSPPSTAQPVTAPGSGFLIGVNAQAMLNAAVDADAVIVLDPHPGDSLVAGTPMAWIWPRHNGNFDTLQRDQLAECVRDAVSVGFERTATQDIGFGLRQLTDVANKALSPGVNDPTTAIHALGHAAALLCEIADRALGPRVLTDADEVTRVVLRRPDLADLLDLAISQPRRYGAGDPSVLAQIYVLLRQLAWSAPADQGDVILAQLARLDATAAAQDFDAAEQAQLAVCGSLVRAATARRWPARDR
ncbi:MAG: DUF2254 domain-containing protein [Pseudonocardiales bacterium]